MYDLEKAKDDFPWTRVTYNKVEPWLEIGSGWFDDMYEGWGDIIHKGLTEIDAVLRDEDACAKIVIAQVKEKFGGLRMYVDLIYDDVYLASEDEETIRRGQRWVKRLFDTIHRMENETETVCCWCGTKENLAWRRGWIHLSCDACEAKHAHG